MGIEPTSEAWEASILPLYDARSEAIVPANWLAGKRCSGRDSTSAGIVRRPLGNYVGVGDCAATPRCILDPF
jgi:hypothetical protein